MDKKEYCWKISNVWMLFIVLAVITFAFAIMMVLPVFRDFIGTVSINAVGVISILLAIFLIYYSYREGLAGALRWFVIIFALSPASFYVFTLLHNILYGLGIIYGDGGGIEIFFNVSEAATFLLAVFVVPAVYLISFIGSAILLIKARNTCKIIYRTKKK